MTYTVGGASMNLTLPDGTIIPFKLKISGTVTVTNPGDPGYIAPPKESDDGA